MRPNAKRLAVGALLGLALAGAEVGGGTARAAEDPPPVQNDRPTVRPAQENGQSDKPAAISEEPPVNYVRDQQGRLVPLLGFTWEELQEFLRQKQAGKNGEAQPREFDLQQVVIAGEATDSRAELTATYKIRLDEEKWVEAPLVSGGAVLTEPAAYRGPGEHLVRFDSATGAYSVRLRGPPRSQHELTLKYFAPLKNVAGQRRLELELPSAAASRLSLKVPLESAAVTASTGAVTAEVNRLGSGKSEINAWGLGGPLSLSWKEGAGMVAAATSRLEAEGQILARLDSRSVQFDVTLSVRSMAEGFDRFQIKLPPDTKHITGETTTVGYTLSGGMEDSDIVTVQLPQKTKGPVEVRLRAERAYDAKNPNEALELAGFEVVEAIPHRQWGHIAVVVNGDWQTTFDNTDRVRQVEELPAALRKDNALGFEYFGQPASLSVRVSPRKTRIAVEPEYVYFVEPDRIRLEAKLKYVIRGAKALDLAVEMPGWIPDDLRPGDAIDLDEFWAGEGPLHSVPLIQGVSGKFELTILAHRLRTDDSDQIELTLPTPHADVVEPALVAIVPANNVRLRPNEGELVGLNRLSSSGTLQLPAQEQSPLVYRADRTQAIFVADAERLPQAVSAMADGTIDVRHDGVLVEQRFQYRVEHEPLDALTLEVPKQIIAADGDWKILVDDTSVAPLPPMAGDTDSATELVRAPLLEPRSGTFIVKIKYRLPLEPMELESGEPVRVPLIVPRGLSLVSNQLSVSSESTLRVGPYDEQWSLEENAEPTMDGNDLPALRLSAAHAVPELLLTASREERRGTGSTVVDRAWVQTWLGGGVRQDRAVYRLNGSEEQVSVTLPEGVALNHVELKVDGAPVTPQPDLKRTLTVRLPEQNSGRSHVLELKYQFADDSADTGSIEAELPRFTGNVWVQRLYWQLAVPGNRHLVEADDELTPEFTWQWNGAGWERRSSMEQPDLEEWIGIETATAPLPTTMNRYLFSMAGSPKTLTVWTAGRGELVFVVSLVVLAFGLLLIYVRGLRRPIALFAAGVIVAALAAWQIESALLFVQSALLGLALVLLAILLEYTQTRRRAPSTIVRSGGSSIVESRPAPTSVRTAEPIAPASTESLPVEMELPAAGSSSR